MNRTLGYTLVTCVLAGAALSAGSWWLGQRIETQYNLKLDQWAQDYASDFEIVERRYERGIFSARATLVVKMALPETAADEEDDDCEEVCEDESDGMRPASLKLAAAGNGSANPADEGGNDEAGDEQGEAPRTLRLHLVNDIRHGPLAGARLAAAAIDSHIVHIDGLDLSEKGKQAFAGAKPPTAHLVIGFDQEVDGQVRLPAGEIVDPDNAANHVRWQQLDYDFRIPAGQQRLTGTAAWPSLSAHLDMNSTGLAALELKLDNLRSRFDGGLPHSRSVLVPGSYTDQADSLQIRYASSRGGTLDNLLTLRDIRSETRITQDGKTVNVDNRVDSKGQIAQVAIDKLAIRTTLHNLDEGALDALLEVLNAHPDNDLGTLDTDSIEFRTPLRQLLAAGPQLRSSLNATIGNETASLSHALQLAEPDLSSPETSLMQAIQKKAAADLSLRLPMSWAELIATGVGNPGFTAANIRELAQFGVVQGMLRQEGKDWVASGRLRDGKLFLNDKPIGSL